MKLRTFVPAVAAALLAAGAAAAQSADSAAAAHNTSIALGIGDSPTIGLWRRFSPNVEAGLEISGRIQKNSYNDGAQEYRSRAIGGGPAIKVYAGPEGVIRPYLFGSVGVTFNDDRSESAGATPTATRQRGHGFDAAAALGLEWAPTERIRLGGHAGIRGMTGSGTFTPTTGEDVENETSGLTTFTSGIRAQLYF